VWQAQAAYLQRTHHHPHLQFRCTGNSLHHVQRFSILFRVSIRSRNRLCMGFSCVSAGYISRCTGNSLHNVQRFSILLRVSKCVGSMRCSLHHVHRFSILFRVSKCVGSMRWVCMCVCVRARSGVESRDSLPTSAKVWSRVK
jgi:hypothetical protein